MDKLESKVVLWLGLHNKLNFIYAENQLNIAKNILQYVWPYD